MQINQRILAYLGWQAGVKPCLELFWHAALYLWVE